MAGPSPKGQPGRGYQRIVILGFLSFLIIMAMVFASAGRLDYWQGWVFGGVNLLLLAADSIIFSRKQDLIRERFKPGPGTKWWDKLFYVLYVPMFFAIYVVASLDSGRFHWAAPVPMLIYVLAAVFYVFSHLLQFWAKWTNRFFSSTVRIQTDRGHEVVQDGPYRIVRHPGYVSGILMAMTSSLVLGSLSGLIPAGAVMALLVVRTGLEDRTLRNELAGYADYAQQTRFRLLPGVW